MSEHLEHVDPYLNYTSLQSSMGHINLTNLDDLNDFGRGGQFVYLKSEDDVETRPDWLSGKKNIPSFANKIMFHDNAHEQALQFRLRSDGEIVLLQSNS